jgi:hypothetical protein
MWRRGDVVLYAWRFRDRGFPSTTTRRRAHTPTSSTSGQQPIRERVSHPATPDWTLPRNPERPASVPAERLLVIQPSFAAALFEPKARQNAC